MPNLIRIKVNSEEELNNLVEALSVEVKSTFFDYLENKLYVIIAIETDKIDQMKNMVEWYEFIKMA